MHWNVRVAVTRLRYCTHVLSHLLSHYMPLTYASSVWLNDAGDKVFRQKSFEDAGTIRTVCEYWEWIAAFKEKEMLAQYIVPLQLCQRCNIFQRDVSNFWKEFGFHDDKECIIADPRAVFELCAHACVSQYTCYLTFAISGECRKTVRNNTVFQYSHYLVTICMRICIRPNTCELFMANIWTYSWGSLHIQGEA